MSGLRRAIRHPDRTRDPHVRAHGLLSDRFTEILAPADAAWLDEHLAGCVPCQLTADAWAADRELLHQLAATMPAPPRDLGARLAAALDVEEAKAPRRGRSAPRPARRRAGPPPRRSALALAGVVVAAIVALVVLPVVLPFGGPGESSIPGTTPVAVDTDPVAFAHRTSDGTYLISATAVDRVCPGNDASACGTLGEVSTPIVALDVRPTTILLPAGGGQGVVVSSNNVYAISFPQPPVDRVTPPPPSPSIPARSANPTPAATGVSASPPADTPVPTGSPAPTDSLAPSVSPSQTSAPPASSAPSETPASSVASLAPGTPAPTVATTLAILDNVVLVGGAPAYSPDGQWVAFSARPADGSHGPDVYVWRAEEGRARAVTDDHASVFSAWVEGRILASTAVEELPTPTPGASATPGPSPRPGASGEPAPSPAPTAAPSETPGPTPEATPTEPEATPTEPEATPTEPAAATPASTEPAASTAPTSAATTGSDGGATPEPGATPSPGSSATAGDGTPAPPTPEPSATSKIVARSFFVDPATGEREPIARAGIWRPVVDPSGRTVVFWTGTLAWSDADAAYLPARGHLVAASWSDVLGGAATLDTWGLPGEAGRIADIATWDTRWDAAGQHLATWIGDAANGGEVVAGMLSLFAVDASGRPSETLLDDAAAMPGFSLGRDRLAWSTPPGRNGQGSLVGVFAWSGTAPGAVYSAPDPGSDPVVVVR